MITLADIEAAAARIRASIYVSPCAYSETYSRATGLRTYFKLENLQMTGSFKERGALNRLLLLSADERQRGVIAASAGNHAQGVAYHATRLGVHATIVMPETTPLIKVVSTREYGAEVVLHGANYDDACEEAQRLAGDRQLTFVHAFDDDAVIAGQGTIGLEILAQEPEVEVVVVPVGGGGLIGGIGCAIKTLRPSVRIIGVEPAGLPSAQRAMTAGGPVTLAPAVTLADGIAVRRAGERTFPLLQRYVDDLVTVSEEELANAVLLLLEREKTVAEGAGAAALAAVVNGRVSIPLGKRTVMLVSGGNIDVNVLSRIIERGLAKDGRMLRLEVRISDSPGSLHALTGVFAARRANVLDIGHLRAFSGVGLGETVVELTLETRGVDHVQEILQALREAGYEHRRRML
ncbi:MAG TPA: threonine ammonia-lyase [Kofleriaceae bacterium]|nr:threonine ammonia-lyase [Kofleriaceae bacterium]